MIVDRPSPRLWRTAISCGLFLLLVSFSLTRESLAQSSPVSGPPATIVYRPEADGLDALFPNGVVATVGDKAITVEDVRREMKQFIPYLEKESRDQAEFNTRFTRQQNQTIRALVERVLLVKEFNQHKQTTGEKHIAAEYLDNTITDLLNERFDGDRSKFLDYLRSRGITLREYRREIEDDIIFHYMKSQERKLDAPGQPAAARGDQVHLRIIQLKRAAGETDATLTEKMNAILARVKNGETFVSVAAELDESSRRARGGDWGWQRLEDLRSDYRDKAAALKPGEVSTPILAPEGGFLLFAEERK